MPSSSPQERAMAIGMLPVGLSITATAENFNFHRKARSRLNNCFNKKRQNTDNLRCGSPDLSKIEQMWDALERRLLRRHVAPRTPSSLSILCWKNA